MKKQKLKKKQTQQANKIQIINVFKNLDNFPMNLIIFKLKDKIFNKYLDKEKFNLLGYLIDDVKTIKKI